MHALQHHYMTDTQARLVQITSTAHSTVKQAPWGYVPSEQQTAQTDADSLPAALSLSPPQPLWQLLCSQLCQVL